MAIIEIGVDGNHYNICYYQKGTRYCSVCDTEEKVIDSVKKYLAMQKQNAEKNNQTKPLSGNEQLELNKIRVTKG